jgi:predicted transcriptional regulator of viral defense system
VLLRNLHYLNGIAKETKIKEPNIRRILGVGAKEGTFERVDKGVYVVRVGGQSKKVIIN